VGGRHAAATPFLRKAGRTSAFLLRSVLLMAETEVIEFFNRYTGRVEQEQVYGAAWMHWTYATSFGRLALEAFVKRPFFSRWYGWRMDQPASRRKILPFIREFGLDMNEFAEPPESFRTFNEFFYRRLK